MVHQTLTQPHTFSRSEGIQCPTTDSSRNCVIGAEPGIAVVSGWKPTTFLEPVREALFNTLRQYVHRGQKDSVIGTLTTYALVNENHLDQIYRTMIGGRPTEFTRQKGHQLSPKKRGDPLLTAHGNIRPYGQVVRRYF